MKDAKNEAQVAALTADLRDGLDPLEVYAHLSDSGTRSDTMLFEQAGGPTILLDRAALRIESRGSDVTATVLSPNGGLLLEHLKCRLRERLIDSSPNSAVFRFPPIASDDSESRLTAPCPFDVLRELTIGLSSNSEDRFVPLGMGVIAYDHVDFHEQLPLPQTDPLGFPDFLFWFAESLVVFEPGNRPRAICTLVGSDSGFGDDRLTAQRLQDLRDRCEQAPSLHHEFPQGCEPDFSNVDISDEAYESLVQSMKARIREGDVYQIVPSRTFQTPCLDAFRAFRVLRSQEQAPYRYFIAEERWRIFGASPEAAVRVSANDDHLVVQTNPIAGTRPRGETSDEDDRLEAELRTDEKELAEHLMLVDLSRNDVARVSVAGTRHVSSLMHVVRHARVMHLASTVTGQLCSVLQSIHAALSCLNVGTLTGAPKIRAMQLLREAELTKRGPYGGAVSWLNGRGEIESAVVIRTAIVSDETAYVRAGAGVVHDSDPKAEAAETKHKAAVVLAAIAAAAA